MIVYLVFSWRKLWEGEANVRSRSQQVRKKKNLRDEVVPLLALLQTTKGHLGTGNVFLGVLEVGEL